MSFLRCKICDGEIDILDNDRSVNKKTKCRQCGNPATTQEIRGPEVIVIRKRSNPDLN
jgi:RNA polymerase subunit RPABC4/transcription elongation factor Spt4